MAAKQTTKAMNHKDDYQALISGMTQAGSVDGRTLENGDWVGGTFLGEEDRSATIEGVAKAFKVYLVKNSEGDIQGVNGAKVLDSRMQGAYKQGLAGGDQIVIKREEEDLPSKVKGRNPPGNYSVHFKKGSTEVEPF